MKERLSSLDGLRGFAALAVFLSHTNFSVSAIPMLEPIYRTIAVGPNSVQILFVLSGFLMAVLYPTLTSNISFIRKRYARIVPLYCVVVLFLSLFLIWDDHAVPLSIQVGVFLALTIGTYGVWKFLTKHGKERLGKRIFYGYLIFQGILFICNLLITPRFIAYDQIQLSETPKNLLIIASNLSFTTNLVNSMPRLSIVFWSLTAEILFYLLYPFIVIPLLKLSKRYGWVISIFFVFAVTKILFDLDKACLSFLGFQSINIARASGFVAGVTVGTIYEMKGELWKKTAFFGKYTVIGILAICAFIFIQWADWNIRDGESLSFMNWYYLISSWVIAFLMMIAIIPKTIPNKIFSSKLLIYIGTISYSLYLIHTRMIDTASNLLVGTRPYVPEVLYPWLNLLLSSILAFSAAFLLFRFVEYIYFATKQKFVAPAEFTEASVRKEEKKRFYHAPFLTPLLIGMILFFIYMGSYSPSFIMQRHSFLQQPNTEVALLKGPLKTTIRSHDKNLSQIIVDMRYYKNAEHTRQTNKYPAQLVLRIFDQNMKNIYESKRNAFVVEGKPRFPFGFPVMANAKGKQYTIELSLENGTPTDQIFVDTSSNSLVTVYTHEKRELITKPYVFLWNKIVFVFSNPDAIFAFSFLLFIVLLELISPKKLKKILCIT